MVNMSDIGQHLIASRRASGMSQRELGVGVGVRQQQIARWESTAYTTASLARVTEVAEVLGVGTGDAALLVAETPALYETEGGIAARPVRDLGEVATRIRRHGSKFHGKYGIDRIGVFGSFAVGDQGPGSDVDLLVDVEEPGGFRFLAAAEFAAGVLGREVDFMRAETLKERLRPRVMREVIWVWHA